ncbi:MAG: alpha-amylase/4-alpha-glucanotransferase domain-containing protein [Campylobacterota bacterium]|nr:alpha-amylase/4-alpha-glucanotransferase domain-containing protein [Campylobacterota bacterium]
MKTSLLFGIHCHQPIDNFDNVVFEIIEKSYKPFFKVLEDFPDFKCSVHFSGWILEFIQQHDLELFQLMQKLSPQIEFFTGGYYEPILASISSKDRVAQIRKLTQFIKKHFKQSPRGLWLTERIWDDSIIDDLAKCDVEYVIVDDYHLIASGHSPNDLNGYFITENSNNHIALFPINKDLRYMVPFATIDETVEKLHTFSQQEGKNAAIIFDDGEKFGIWPKTYQRVYEEEWLREFFMHAIADETIEPLTFEEYFEANHALSLVYLPTVSYHEMGEWSVLPNLSKSYHKLLEQMGEDEYLIRGGIWKNFFLKYDESNWIHKRSLELSKDRIKGKAYEEALFKTQCNDVLWHGVFGGIYLPNLRDNAYRYIIECENLKEIKNDLVISDIDMDSMEEYKFYTPNLLTIIKPRQGGQIVELDIRKECFNLQNTLTRYHEVYHDKIQKVDEEEEEESSSETTTIHNNLLKTTEDIEKITDWYLKKSLIDHISDNSLTLENFKSCSFKEYGDFANQPYEVMDSSKESVTLKREGGIYLPDKLDTIIAKKVTFNRAEIKVEIKLESTCDQELNYISEWNLHFSDYEQVSINGEALEESLELSDSKLVIKDHHLNKKYTYAFDEALNIYLYRTKSISQSESGVDYTTQGITIGFVQSFAKILNFEYSFKVSAL